MKRLLKIAVRELVEFVMRSGDLQLEFMSATRPTEGIRAHQKVQKSRPENYLPEVSVTHQIETEHFLLEVGGRIDGIYSPDAGEPSSRVIIDEIKSTHRDLDTFDGKGHPMHWAQAKCYAFIYGFQKGLKEIEIQLTYAHLETGEILELCQVFSLDELESHFNDLVTRYLLWANRIHQWCENRDKSIVSLRFPFESYRHGQRQMAVDTYKTIKNRGQIIIQAATGIGKTMAVLFPAVKAMAENLHQKIFYLTARTTGRIAAEKALSELIGKGLCLKSVTLTAKDKICFNPESACVADECRYAQGYYDRIQDALHSIFDHNIMTRDIIGEVAKAHRVCPFEFSLDLSLWADCIICDYNYAFDPRVYLRRFFNEGNGDFTFLIDESHNLVDRSRDMFSAELYKQPFLDIRRMLKNQIPHVYKRMGKINGWMVKARKNCNESGSQFYEENLPEDLIPLLRHFLWDAERWLSLNLKTSFREDLLDLYFTVTGFVRVADQYDKCYVTCYETMGKDFRIKLFCMDPSQLMADAMKRCQTAVFFSATMTPTDYFKKILGCRESACTLLLPSPFPPDNLGLFIADRVSTFYKEREQTKDRVTLKIETMIQEKKGNYLLYFPSYAYMKMIYNRFSERNPQIESIMQTSGMSEQEREDFLHRFSNDHSETLVGFAVMGGIFGEGIDLAGERLSGVAIVGVGLPGISLENDLIRNYFDRTNGVGFEYAYLYPGINRVLQAAGRVIRTSRDRGVVLLIDQRFSTYRYRSLFPSTWQAVNARDKKKLEMGLKAFWDS